MRAFFLTVTSLGLLAACSSPNAPIDASADASPGDDASTASCTFVLNQARTILDPDLDCPGAPQRVLCDGIQASNALFPQPFRATYNAAGRLADYYREPRGLSPERVQLEYEEGRLVRVGRRSFTYDERGRLSAYGTRSFHYDDQDRLIRLEDPSGIHGTSRFNWDDDGRLGTIVSQQEGSALQRVQTFLFDEDGQLAHHTVIDDGRVWLDVEFEYDDGDLIRIGETALLYSDEPLDIPNTAGLNRAWFLTGAQSEVYLRTGSATHPWRVYLGDHPGGFVAVYPEFRSAHRPIGTYEMDGDAVSATYLQGNEHEMTFVPVSECMTAPVVTCSGPGPIDGCLDTEFCLYDECSYDAIGVCTPIPADCPTNVAPVCGCDAMTYDNECIAHAAGVSAYAPGECCDEPDPTCGAGEYCRFTMMEETCGIDDTFGFCVTAPESCDAAPAQVCACDGTNHDNECLANMAGRSVAYPGPCR